MQEISSTRTTSALVPPPRPRLADMKNRKSRPRRGLGAARPNDEPDAVTLSVQGAQPKATDGASAVEVIDCEATLDVGGEGPIEATVGGSDGTAAGEEKLNPGGQFLRPELAAAAQKFLSFRGAYEIEAGKLLADVRPKTKRGEWGKFLRFVGITQRTANTLIRLVKSRHATLLAELGPRKAQALLRLDDDKIDAFIAETDVHQVSAAELESLVTKKPRETKRDPVDSKLYRAGFAAARRTTAKHAELLASLLLPPEALHAADLNARIDQHYAILSEALSGYKDLLAILENAVEELKTTHARGPTVEIEAFA